MNLKFLESMINWPKSYISGVDLDVILGGSYDSRHSIIKRAVKDKLLMRLQNDLYVIKTSLKKDLPDVFELAMLIWGPSYISFESALSFHEWIPEAVYTVSSATSKKGKTVETPMGVFDFRHVPCEAFSLGLSSQKTAQGVFLIADPWKSIADMIYSKKRVWKDVHELSEDLRIERESLDKSDLKLLKFLSENYPSPRTKLALRKFHEELVK